MTTKLQFTGRQLSSHAREGHSGRHQPLMRGRDTQAASSLPYLQKERIASAKTQTCLKSNWKQFKIIHTILLSRLNIWEITELVRFFYFIFELIMEHLNNWNKNSAVVKDYTKKKFTMWKICVAHGGYLSHPCKIRRTWKFKKSFFLVLNFIFTFNVYCLVY